MNRYDEDEKLECKLDRMREARACPYNDDGFCNIGDDDCVGDWLNPKKCQVYQDDAQEK